MLVEVISIYEDTKLKNIHSEPGRPKSRNLSFDGISLSLKMSIKCKTNVCSYIVHILRELLLLLSFAS